MLTQGFSLREGDFHFKGFSRLTYFPFTHLPQTFLYPMILLSVDITIIESIHKKGARDNPSSKVLRGDMQRTKQEAEETPATDYAAFSLFWPESRLTQQGFT